MKRVYLKTPEKAAAYLSWLSPEERNMRTIYARYKCHGNMVYKFRNEPVLPKTLPALFDAASMPDFVSFFMYSDYGRRR